MPRSGKIMPHIVPDDIAANPGEYGGTFPKPPRGMEGCKGGQLSLVGFALQWENRKLIIKGQDDDDD